MTEGIESTEKPSNYAECVSSNVIAACAIVLNNVGTEDDPIDMMTKSLPISRFDHCLNLIDIYCRVFLLWAFLREVESFFGGEFLLKNYCFIPCIRIRIKVEKFFLGVQFYSLQ